MLFIISFNHSYCTIEVCKDFFHFLCLYSFIAQKMRKKSCCVREGINPTDEDEQLHNVSPLCAGFTSIFFHLKIQHSTWLTGGGSIEARGVKNTIHVAGLNP